MILMKETEDVVHMNLDFLPLKTNANIIEGNALRTKEITEVLMTQNPKTQQEPHIGGPSTITK